MDHRELIEQTEQYKDEMSPDERSRMYKSGQPVDRIPVSISIRETMAPFYGFTIGEYRRDFEKRAMVYEQACRDFACFGISLGPNLRGIGEALGACAVYPENSTDYIISYPIKDITSVRSLEPPDPYHNTVLRSMMDEMGRYGKRFGKACPISTEIAGPLTTAASILPIESLLAESIEHPDKVHDLLELSLASVLFWVEAVYAEYGIETVNVADPVASCGVIGTHLFRELAKPFLLRLRREVERITGKAPALHICGKTSPIWPDLAELGYASFRVDNCENIAELKRAIGDKMAISGNVPPVDVMLHGTIDQVLEVSLECIRLGADSPCGFTLAAGCQLPPGVPKDNLLAMLLAARKYGRNAKMGRNLNI